MKFFQIKQYVREKLVKDPVTRDNDNYLIGLVLEDLEHNLNEITGSDLIKNIKEDKYCSFESIRRTRQYLQEKNEDLRGETWKERQRHSKNYMQQMRFNFD